MLKIIATTTKREIKVTIKKPPEDCPTVFLSSRTSSLLLGLISSKENLMKTFADLLVAGKKFLLLYTEE